MSCVLLRAGCFAAALWWLSALPCAGQEPGNEPLLRDGDRVVWLGDGFVERMQQHAYLETTLLVRKPEWKLTFRNLGWSGDTVGGLSRAVFGGPDDGFARLKRDVEAAHPTVVVLHYGANEAHQGDAGLEAFERQTTRLFEFLDTLNVRLIVVAPRACEDAPRFRVSGARHRERLARYRRVLRQVTLAHGGDWLPWDAFDCEALTRDGVHLTPSGYRIAAQWLADRLLGPSEAWAVSVDADRTVGPCRGAEVSDVQRDDRSLTFLVRSDTQPDPAAPDAVGPPPSVAVRSVGTLTLTGLEPGNYALFELRGDAERRLHEATDQQWAAGLALSTRDGAERVERIRQLAIQKNAMYFHRYRPQNETYLFLFRKHEQGVNAVEPPQFEPIVEAIEGRIESIRAPRPVRWVVRRVFR